MTDAPFGTPRITVPAGRVNGFRNRKACLCYSLVLVEPEQRLDTAVRKLRHDLKRDAGGHLLGNQPSSLKAFVSVNSPLTTI